MKNQKLFLLSLTILIGSQTIAQPVSLKSVLIACLLGSSSAQHNTVAATNTIDNSMRDTVHFNQKFSNVYNKQNALFDQSNKSKEKAYYGLRGSDDKNRGKQLPGDDDNPDDNTSIWDEIHDNKHFDDKLK